MDFKRGLDFQHMEDNYIYSYLYDKSTNKYLTKHRWSDMIQTTEIIWFDKTEQFESHFEAIIWLKERKKLVDKAMQDRI